METKTIENYHYLESGLEYVFLKKVKAIETPYGLSINITNVTELHKKISLSILKNNIPLRGKELRFLRKSLRMTQIEISGLLGVAQSTLATWEGRDLEERIDTSHAYFLQQFFREKHGLDLMGPSALIKMKEAGKEFFKIAV